MTPLDLATVKNYVRDCLASPTPFPPRISPDVVASLSAVLEEVDRLKRREASAILLASKAAGFAVKARPHFVSFERRAECDRVTGDALRFLGRDSP